MAHRLYVDDSLSTFLEWVKNSFVSGNQYVPYDIEIQLDKHQIILKKGDVIDYLRVPRKSCRPGDPDAEFEPHVWWRFTVNRRYGPSWPIKFEVSADGQHVTVRTPRNASRRIMPGMHQMAMSTYDPGEWF